MCAVTLAASNGGSGIILGLLGGREEIPDYGCCACQGDRPGEGGVQKEEGRQRTDSHLSTSTQRESVFGSSACQSPGPAVSAMVGLGAPSERGEIFFIVQ